DYEGAIPSGNNSIMYIAVRPFSQAVDRVATISTDRFSGIRVKLLENKVTLTAANEDTGAAQEEIEVDYKGDSIDIGFNSKYLLDITQQIEGEEAQVALS